MRLRAEILAVWADRTEGQQTFMYSARVTWHIFMVHVSRVLRKTLAGGQPQALKIFPNALEKTPVRRLLIGSHGLRALHSFGMPVCD